MSPHGRHYIFTEYLMIAFLNTAASADCDELDTLTMAEPEQIVIYSPYSSENVLIALIICRHTDF